MKVPLPCKCLVPTTLAREGDVERVTCPEGITWKLVHKGVCIDATREDPS